MSERRSYRKASTSILTTEQSDTDLFFIVIFPDPTIPFPSYNRGHPKESHPSTFSSLLLYVELS